MNPDTEFSSQLLENAVNRLSQLPGVGRRTALRLALHILRREKEEGVALGEAIIRLRQDIRYCRECHNICDDDICEICSDGRRDSSVICVVENVKDVMHFERTGQFRGKYHVLNGLISPMDGVGPDVLEIDSLVERVSKGNVSEVILALSATIEGDTTNYYIYKKLKPYNVSVSQLARGVAVGNEIEFTDEITLGRSLLNRTPFNE